MAIFNVSNSLGHGIDMSPKGQFDTTGSPPALAIHEFTDVSEGINYYTVFDGGAVNQMRYYFIDNLDETISIYTIETGNDDDLLIKITNLNIIMDYDEVEYTKVIS